jgi:hypothetical protein
VTKVRWLENRPTHYKVVYKTSCKKESLLLFGASKFQPLTMYNIFSKIRFNIIHPSAPVPKLFPCFQVFPHLNIRMRATCSLYFILLRFVTNNVLKGTNYECPHYTILYIRSFLWVSTFPPINCWHYTVIKPRLLPSKSFLIHFHQSSTTWRCIAWDPGSVVKSTSGNKLTSSPILCSLIIQTSDHLQSVTERCGQTLGTSSTYQIKIKYPNQHVSGNI